MTIQTEPFEMSPTLTEKAIAGLRWFAKNGPIGWFPVQPGSGVPTLAMRRRFERQGLTERVPGGGGVAVIKYRLSKKGWRALEDHAGTVR